MATFTTVALTLAAVNEEIVISTDEETEVPTGEENPFLAEAYNPETRF